LLSNYVFNGKHYFTTIGNSADGNSNLTVYGPDLTGPTVKDKTFTIPLGNAGFKAHLMNIYNRIVLALLDTAGKSVSFQELDFWTMQTKQFTGFALTGQNIPQDSGWCPVDILPNPYHRNLLEILSFCPDSPNPEKNKIYSFDLSSIEVDLMKNIVWNLLGLDGSVNLDNAASNNPLTVCGLGDFYLTWEKSNTGKLIVKSLSLDGNTRQLYDLSRYNLTGVEDIVCPTNGGSMFIVIGNDTKNENKRSYGIVRANESYNSNNKMMPLVEITGNKSARVQGSMFGNAAGKNDRYGVIFTDSGSGWILKDFVSLQGPMLMVEQVKPAANLLRQTQATPNTDISFNLMVTWAIGATTIDDLYRIEVFYPNFFGTLTPNDEAIRQTIAPNAFDFKSVFSQDSTRGPIFEMSLINKKTDTVEDSDFIKLQPRVEHVFSVGQEFQKGPVFPKQFRKLKTFNHKYVLGMGDFPDATGVPHGSLMFGDRDTFEKATTSPDFKYSICYDFSIVPKITDKDYIMINLCDTENTTSKLTIFSADDVSAPIPTVATFNDIRLNDYYDQIETLGIDLSTVMVFLRKRGDKKLESYIISIGRINLVAFYHFSIQKIGLEWGNVNSFSVVKFSTGAQPTAILNILQEDNPEFTSYFELAVSPDPTKVKIQHSGRLYDEFYHPVAAGEKVSAEDIKGYKIGSQFCYNAEPGDGSKVLASVGCVLSMSMSHLKEFTITASATAGMAPTMTKSIPRIRVFGNMVPIDGSIKANKRYVTYLAKGMKAIAKSDPTTGELLHKLDLMVYDKQCKTCKSVSNISSALNPDNAIEYLELFQAVSPFMPNTKLDTYNLPGYDLDQNFIFAATNSKKALGETYKINEDYNFIVYKDTLNVDLSEIIVNVNMAFQHGESSVAVSLDKIFRMGDDSSYTLYWVFGGIILAVAIIVGVVFLVICIKKKKTPGLRINRDDLENILVE
jgi:hypothetical protein